MYNVCDSQDIALYVLDWQKGAVSGVEIDYLG